MLPAFGIGVLIVLLGVGIWVRFSQRRKLLGNILIPCCLIAVSLIFLALTFEFRSEEAGPALIPRLWIVLILCLSGIVLWRIFRGKEDPVAKIEQPRLLALVTAALLAYFIALPYLGYFLSSFLFLVFVLHILAYRKKARIYLIAGGWCLFSYLVFYKLLYIQLPLGWWEDVFR